MSPTLLQEGPYRIYIYSYDCHEPRREDKSAKFWLDPVVILAANYGYSRAELRRIERLLTENLTVLRERWDEFCGHYSSIA